MIAGVETHLSSRPLGEPERAFAFGCEPYEPGPRSSTRTVAPRSRMLTLATRPRGAAEARVSSGMTFLLALAFVPLLVMPAFACEFCGGTGGDYSSASIWGWMIASAHASILDGLASANAAIARGDWSSAIVLPLAMGLSYGIVHALGPGHGKIVFGAYSFAQKARVSDILWRAFGSGALHVLSALAIMVFLSLLFGFGGTPGEAQLKPVQAAGYTIVTIVGIALIVRAVLPNLPLLGHRHSEATSAAGMVLGVGLVPCTGSLLVITFAVANKALTLGLAVISAIGLGMAATLGAIGLLAGAAGRAVTTDHHRHARWPSVVGGVFLIATGLFFLHGLTL